MEPQLAVRHLDGDQTLQLVIVGEVAEAESALTEDFLDAVATDVRGRGFRKDRLDGFPSGFVYGLVRIVHTDCL